MSERALPLTKVVRLASGELAETTPCASVPPPIALLAIVILVGTAWWAASGK